MSRPAAWLHYTERAVDSPGQYPVQTKRFACKSTWQRLRNKQIPKFPEYQMNFVTSGIPVQDRRVNLPLIDTMRYNGFPRRKPKETNNGRSQSAQIGFWKTCWSIIRARMGIKDVLEKVLDFCSLLKAFSDMLRRDDDGNRKPGSVQIGQ